MSEEFFEEYPEEEYVDENGIDNSAYTNAFAEQPREARPVPCTPEELHRLQQDDIQDVMSVVCCDRSCAGILLKRFSWNRDILKERYFDDPEKVARDSGVDPTTSYDLSLNKEVETCLLCWDDVEPSQAGSMACKHWFCLSCWESTLAYRVNNTAKECLSTQCPQKDCPYVCGESVFSAVFPAETNPTRQKFYDFFKRSYVEDSEHYRWCTNPLCRNAVRSYTARKQLEGDSVVVQCSCGERFCFLCMEEAHAPASCKHLRDWLKKEQDESETANWVTANTKPCPKCGSTIEKDGGCNHMTCPRCRYEFCWVCEDVWEKHGSSWYKCNYYEESKDAKKEGRNSARQEVERYMFYFTRYKNHDMSKKLENKLLARIQTRVEDLMRAGEGLEEVDYLRQSAVQLCQCRHTLKYTYAYAYFLPAGNRKQLFEYNQSQLEHSTEVLSEMIEDKHNRFARQDVVNRTNVAQQMLDNLEKGLFQES